MSPTAVMELEPSASSERVTNPVNPATPMANAPVARTVPVTTPPELTMIDPGCDS